MKIQRAIEKSKKREFWEDHIKCWKASSQTQSHYCRLHQLKIHQLLYWKKILRDLPSTTNTDSKNSGFISITVKPSPPTAQTLVLELSNGVRITGIHAGNLNVIQDIIGWKL